MKVLFLDVDGVLNNSTSMGRGGGCKNFDPVSVDALNRVLTTTGAQIVVSSTWRFMYDTREFNEMLKLAAIHPVAIGATTKEDAKPGPGSVWIARPRGELISEWLREHPEVETYAVVDDSFDAGHGHTGRFVQTRFDGGGLRPEHADRLIEILRVVSARGSEEET